jgi:hypothetical protein
MTTTGFSPLLITRLLTQPSTVFEELSSMRPNAAEVFFKLSIWLGLLPPLFAYIGASNYGWNLGASEPLYVPGPTLVGISFAYFLTLLLGFVTTALVSQWMAATYGARLSLGIHMALITVVAAPLAVGSVIHLYPHVFLNVLVLVPTLIWCMYLLYSGLPVALRIDPRRGMLMASALIAYLLVAAVSLLGLTAMLWVHGIGPRVGY